MLHHAVGRRHRHWAVDRLCAEREAGGGLVQRPVRPADDELTAAQREVVSLKIDGGLTFAQIATVLGTNMNTIAGRYRAALDKLRAAVTPPEAT